MKKKCLKFGYSLFYLIPVYSIIFFFLLITIMGGSIGGTIFILTIIFFSLTLNYRWVLCFKENLFTTFYFVEGIKKIPYKKITKIAYEPRNFGALSVISIYFVKNNKIKFAKFEIGSTFYIPEVLNFLKDKVENGIIENKGFEKAGIKLVENNYKRFSVN